MLGDGAHHVGLERVDEHCVAAITAQVRCPQRRACISIMSVSQAILHSLQDAHANKDRNYGIALQPRVHQCYSGHACIRTFWLCSNFNDPDAALNAQGVQK